MPIYMKYDTLDGVKSDRALEVHAIDMISSPKGTQFLPGGGYSPLQSSIHTPPGSLSFYQGADAGSGNPGLLGGDLSLSIQKHSMTGLLLPAVQAAREAAAKQPETQSQGIIAVLIGL